MIINKAQQSLSALAQLGGQAAETESAQDVLNRTEAMIAPQDTQAVDPDDEARFDVANAALVTAGLAPFIGPAAVVVGGAVGFLGKQSQQNMLDAMAERENAITASYQVMREGFEADLYDGMPETDRAQVAGNLAALEGAFEMMLDPNTQQTGAQIYGQAVMAQERYRATNDQQAINQAAQERADDIALGKERANVTRGLQRDFLASSQTYVSTVETANLIREQINSGNVTALGSAMRGYVKLLEPDSAILMSELGGVGAPEGLLDEVQAWAKKLESGVPLTRNERAQLYDAVGLIEDARTATQNRLQGQYSMILEDEGLADPVYEGRYTRRFNLTNMAPPRVPYRAYDDPTPATATITNQIEDAAKQGAQDASGFWDAAKLGIDATGQRIQSTLEGAFGTEDTRPRPAPGTFEGIDSNPYDDIRNLPTLSTN